MPIPFLSENFLLHSETARKLYFDFAEKMPVLDYHCHLPPDQIAENRIFENYTQIGLYGDHYKWRAMRTNGVDEKYITGESTDFEKFQKWSETVPYTMRNPLYHWTHMELNFPFGIKKLLDKNTAQEIYQSTAEKLNHPDFSVQNLLRKYKVKIVCTTDDPIDTLEHHNQLYYSGYEVKVLPTFRPDKAMQVSDAKAFGKYVEAIGQITDKTILYLSDYLEALKQRHDYFHKIGCRLSDHGLESIPWTKFTEGELAQIFNKLRIGQQISEEEQLKFRAFMLFQFATWDYEKGWTQQFHLGAIRNNNSRMMRKLGADTGFDSIGSFSHAQSLASFFNALDNQNKLAKTIIYNLNPADNELFATMIGNFNDGSIAGKMQYGSAWWFLDQKDGMEKQINALSNLGLLSRFVGMLTDSRSFLSYSRHEYFRRILCNLIGQDVENGELPEDIAWLGKMVEGICYQNAEKYFQF